MQIEDIEVDFRRQVEETRSLFGGTDLPVVEGLEARGTPCIARAIELINDTGRKESDGVRFRLEFGRPDRRYSATVEVRIKAESSLTKDGSGIANGPYVALYVLEIDSGKGILSFFEQFENVDAYFRTIDDPIEAWYAKWLRRLLRLETGTIVFKHMKPI